MRWQVRFARNALFGIFPPAVQQRLRALKRKVKPYNLDIDVRTLDQGILQVKMLRDAGCDPAGKDLLEIGTGWKPVIPLVFYLAGCRSVTLVDSQRLLDRRCLAGTARNLLAHKDRIAEGLGASAGEVERRLRFPGHAPMEALLDGFGFRYLAPYDLLWNDLPAASLDVVTSRAVLEHVPPRVVQGMFHEAQRLLRPGGVMCHIIDNSDHWEHGDKRLSRLNFLQTGERLFRFLSSMNPLDYQNRLRHSQYREMMEKAGFRIVADDSRPDPEALEDLKTLKIHESFRRFTPEDLATLTSYLVAAK
ncbi:MAG TPA: class I SAM-dependent methyltransferase [Gemmataceae bacterium]